MHSIFFTVGKVRTDIGVVLSDAIVAANPSSSGRGAVRLYNVDDNAQCYLAFADAEPAADVAGIPIPFGAVFQDDIQVTPGGGCWAWSNMNGTKMQAVVTGWS